MLERVSEDLVLINGKQSSGYLAAGRMKGIDSLRTLLFLYRKGAIGTVQCSIGAAS